VNAGELVSSADAFDDPEQLSKIAVNNDVAQGYVASSSSCIDVRKVFSQQAGFVYVTHTRN
jgi:hypothetical protein